MKRLNTLLIPAALSASALCAGTSHSASISLVDTDFADTTSTSLPGNFTLTSEGTTGTRDGIYSYSYDAGASFGMLVVSVSREATAVGGSFGVTYGNVAMNLATGTTDGTGVSIFYLATSNSSGTIALDFTDWDTLNPANTSLAAAVQGIGIGIAAIKSDNGDPIGLFDALSSDSGTSISIDTADNSFTMWAVDTNLNAFSDLAAPQIIKDQDIGSNGYAAAYELVATGVIGDTYSYTNGNNPRGIAAANFYVVPEPGSLAILGLGGLMMIKRRRRD